MDQSATFQRKINGLVHPDVVRVMLLKMIDLGNTRDARENLVEFVSNQFASIGAQPTIERTPTGSRQVVATLQGTGKGPKLLFGGWLHPRENADEPRKNAGLFDGEWIYGTSASNMTCAFAAYFGAMKAIRQAGLSLRGDVVMAGAVGEEPLINMDWDAAIIGRPTGLKIQPPLGLAPDHPILNSIATAHRTIFFGRDALYLPAKNHPPAQSSVSLRAIAYGPGGIDRAGADADEDKELGEIVSVPNLVMCTKVYALAAVDICSGERGQWPH